MLDRLVAGDTVSFTTAVPDYPASAGWTLVYHLVLRSGTGTITLTGTADSADPDLYRIQVPAATTASWTAGEYSWASWVEQGAERHSLSSGSVVVLANPATATGSLDLRSSARRALDDAKAAWYAMSANPGVKSYTIAGRSMTFRDPADLAALIEKLEVEVAREERADRAAKGYADRRRYTVRMTAS